MNDHADSALVVKRVRFCGITARETNILRFKLLAGRISIEQKCDACPLAGKTAKLGTSLCVLATLQPLDMSWEKKVVADDVRLFEFEFRGKELLQVEVNKFLIGNQLSQAIGIEFLGVIPESTGF